MAVTCFLHCPSITAQAGEPGTAVRQAGACAGSFNSSWDDLGSGLSELKLPRNDLNQQLLPSTWGQAWPNLWHLELSGSNISSTLPKQWGLGGAFPKLSKLILAGNTNLTGLPQPPRSSTSDETPLPTACAGAVARQSTAQPTRLLLHGTQPPQGSRQLSEGVFGPGILPPEWGSQNDGALAKLDALWVADCSLFGSLPGGWGTQLPSLWQLSAMNNQLIGAFLVPSTAAVRLRHRACNQERCCR